MKTSTKWILLASSAISVACIAYFIYRAGTHQDEQVAPSTQPASVVAVPSEVAPASSVQSTIKNPIGQIEMPSGNHNSRLVLDKSESLVRSALLELLGNQAVQRFLNVDDFVRHTVATVDNLAREHAASRLWPVQTTPGHVWLLERSDGTYLAKENAQRYEAFVRFATSIDLDKAVALYVRLYPLFQQANEELGYPGKYFNDRLIEVIDQLLDTPIIPEPIKLTLTKVPGSPSLLRPWSRYEFADPYLESLSAGQRLLLRMGAKNEQIIKGLLFDFRKRIAAKAPQQPPTSAAATSLRGGIEPTALPST